MNRSESELDNAVCTTYSVKEDCWLGHVIQMDHQHIPRQALHWEVPGFKRGPGRPRTNWRSTVNKDLLRMGGSRGGSSKQIRVASKCGPMHPLECGVSQGQGSLASEKSEEQSSSLQFAAVYSPALAVGGAAQLAAAH